MSDIPEYEMVLKSFNSTEFDDVAFEAWKKEWERVQPRYLEIFGTNFLFHPEMQPAPEGFEGKPYKIFLMCPAPVRDPI
jgi:hypothetical protein